MNEEIQSVMDRLSRALDKRLKTSLSKQFNREKCSKKRDLLKSQWQQAGYTGRIGGRNAKY